MRVLPLKQVELVEVPGGGASERGHVLYQDHPSPKHVEVHRVALQRRGPQVVESLCDERHLAPSLDPVGMRVRGCSKPLGQLTQGEKPG